MKRICGMNNEEMISQIRDSIYRTVTSPEFRADQETVERIIKELNADDTEDNLWNS